MSLPDTAKYWWDVKRNYPYCGTEYLHIPNYDCGHKHYHEAKYVDEVNCTSCKNAIKNGYEHGLLSAEEHTKRIKQAEIDRNNHKRLDSIKRHPDNPLCECGYAMRKMRNHKNGIEFWGCCHYPICKKTKPI